MVGLLENRLLPKMAEEEPVAAYARDLEAVRRYHRMPAGERPRRAGNGKFIALEGPAAEGYGVLAGRVARALCERGLEVIVSREPGGSPGSEALRRLLAEDRAGGWSPTAEMLLHTAQRLDHLQKVVVPALQEGVWVISDGYLGYSIARLGYGRGLGRDAILRLHHQACGGLLADLSIVLAPPVEAGPAAAADDEAGRIAEGYRALTDDPEIGGVALGAADGWDDQTAAALRLIDRRFSEVRPD